MMTQCAQCRAPFTPPWWAPARCCSLACAEKGDLMRDPRASDEARCTYQHPSGAGCARRSDGGPYCWQHAATRPTRQDLRPEALCQGRNQLGEPCRNWALHGLPYCRHHRGDDAPAAPATPELPTLACQVAPATYRAFGHVAAARGLSRAELLERLVHAWLRKQAEKTEQVG